ncbi:MAG TPA: hypothetical protein VMD92_03165 [Acidobacteriaceae bacterium]|nr:hypothetical protein [Acidobacteriaceae bacterium]HTW46920.1 hypothetical protein [Acidobacteriaceae bacterium]
MLEMTGPGDTRKQSLAGLLAIACLASLAAAAQTPTPPIRLDPVNPHYFLFRGKTIALVTSGEHYGAVINRAFDYHRYLATLAADGLNETRIFGGSYVEVPGQSFGILRNDLAPAPGDFIAPWARSATPGYAGGGNKFDLNRWNPEYFRRLHDFLDEASRLGIVVEISLFSSQYGEAQWSLSPFNALNNVNGTELSDWKKVNTLDNGSILHYQEAYVRKLVHETVAFDNVIYEIQNEPWSDRPVPAGVINPYLPPPARDQFPNTVDVADQQSLNWQLTVAGWILDAQRSRPTSHLIAECYANFRTPTQKILQEVQIVNFHYAWPEAVTWNYGLDKAIAYDETGFLGPEDAAYRRQAWNFMMSGGSAFDALDYSFSPGHEDGTDTAPNGPGGGSPALRRQLGILSEFLHGLPLEHMRPDAQTFVWASPAVARALSWPGHVWAAYLDGRGPAVTSFSLPAGHYAIRWISVVDGAVVAHEQLSSPGGNASVVSPAFEDGIALRLERTGP